MKELELQGMAYGPEGLVLGSFSSRDDWNTFRGIIITSEGVRALVAHSWCGIDINMIPVEEMKERFPKHEFGR